MKVGAARVEITPPLGLQLDGFESRTAGATDVHDPLFARALVAEDASGTAVGLVVSDLVEVGEGIQDLVAARVAGSVGLVRERLQLVATHTHSGPRVERGSAVEAQLAEGIALALERAWSVRVDAVIGIGIGHVDGIGANRRPRGGPVDDRVSVVRIDASDGRPVATLINYGCHPTTLGPDNLRYSADYPGVVCREVEGRIGGVALFTTGPQGDVNPGGYSPEDSMIGIVVPWRTFESAERYGRAIADVAVDVRSRTTPTPADHVWGDSRLVSLRRKPLPEASEAERAAALARSAADLLAGVPRMSVDALHHAQIAAAYAELAAAQASASDPDAPVVVRASALGFGPFVHVGVSGELFVALGQRIRSEVGDATTCVAALCDGSVGYIPTADVIAEGAYEPNASVLRAGEGERLVEEVVALVAAAEAGQVRSGAING